MNDTKAQVGSATAYVEKHSVGPHGVHAFTMVVRYWRAMHAEMLTHRVFSRNASSSRAIPVAKMLRQVWWDPAGPTHWGANQPGMQAHTELTGWRLRAAKLLWKSSARFAAIHSWAMMKIGVHKQIANRPTEPYQYMNVIITATEWRNFFDLRKHKDAQPEIQHVAEAIWNSQMLSTPVRLQAGQWHIPFLKDQEFNQFGLTKSLQLSTARSARVSTKNHDGSDPVPAKDMQLHDDLVGSSPIHASPTEHQLYCLETNDWCANIRGFKQYRKFVEAKYININGKAIPLALQTISK